MPNRQDPSSPRRTSHSVPVALQREATRTSASIRVTSPQIDGNNPIPERHTEYGEGRSPVLHWKPIGGARSYAVLVEDPDAPGPEPFVHWLVWNIPPDMHELPEDIRADTKPQPPSGIRQGRNGRGTIGWFGPRPPAGDTPHHYHFQVLALDAMLNLEDGASRDELLRTIDGRVIAKGELVATSQAPTQQ